MTMMTRNETSPLQRGHRPPLFSRSHAEHGNEFKSRFEIGNFRFQIRRTEGGNFSRYVSAGIQFPEFFLGDDIPVAFESIEEDHPAQVVFLVLKYPGDEAFKLTLDHQAIQPPNNVPEYGEDAAHDRRMPGMLRQPSHPLTRSSDRQTISGLITTSGSISGASG